MALVALPPLRRRRYVGDALVQDGINRNEIHSNKQHIASTKMIEGLQQMRRAHSQMASKVASQIMKMNVVKMFILIVILVLQMYIAFFKNEAIYKCEDICTISSSSTQRSSSRLIMMQESHSHGPVSSFVLFGFWNICQKSQNLHSYFSDYIPF